MCCVLSYYTDGPCTLIGSSNIESQCWDLKGHLSQMLTPWIFKAMAAGHHSPLQYSFHYALFLPPLRSIFIHTGGGLTR